MVFEEYYRVVLLVAKARGLDEDQTQELAIMALERANSGNLWRNPYQALYGRAKTMQEQAAKEPEVVSIEDQTWVCSVIPFDLILNDILRDRLKEVLPTLTPREEKVIEMLFGLYDEDEVSLERVADEFHVTVEKVRQIRAKALRKLRSKPRRAKLLGFL